MYLFGFRRVFTFDEWGWITCSSPFSNTTLMALLTAEEKEQLIDFRILIDTLKFNTLLGLNLLTQSHEQGITPVDNVFEALQELLNINNYKRNMDKLALKRKPQTSTPMDVLNHIALQARIIIWRFSSGNRMTDNRDYL